jgi:hypothetical protein
MRTWRASPISDHALRELTQIGSVAESTSDESKARGPCAGQLSIDRPRITVVHLRVERSSLESRTATAIAD